MNAQQKCKSAATQNSFDVNIPGFNGLDHIAHPLGRQLSGQPASPPVPVIIGSGK